MNMIIQSPFARIAMSFSLLFILIIQSQVSMAAENGRDDASEVQKPEILVAPGVPIESDPVAGTAQTQKRSWLSRNKWWVTLGAVVCGGIAAAIAAGGGGGGDGEDEDGSYLIIWN